MNIRTQCVFQKLITVEKKEFIKIKYCEMGKTKWKGGWYDLRNP